MRRILIAEDDALQGTVLRGMLEGRGYEAEIVSDGLEAVRRLRTGRFDLALLDYHLPVVDGLAAARLLHDFLQAEDRPRLIAVTAAADGLREKEASSGGTPFDAVVAKRHGLPALLAVVDATLASAAERGAMATVERGRKAMREAVATRRRRQLAPLAGLPALALVAVFMAAIGWATASLRHVDAAIGSAQRAGALGADATGLVDAMSDAEASQRSYLATGTLAHRELFEADVARVDRLLVGPAPLSADGSPGFDVGADPQAVIEPRLRTLAEEAGSRPAAAGEGPPSVAAGDMGRDVAARLRAWAAGVAQGSQRAVFAGLEAARHNTVLVLLALATGALYGLWNAGRAVRLRWRDAGPAPGLRVVGAWGRPPPLPLAAQRVGPPLLLHEG